MVELKPSHPSDGDESMILNNGKKGQSSNLNNFIGMKPQNKPILEPESETNFQGLCTYLEGYIFDLGTRASKCFAQEWYFGATYSDSCQTDITTETTATFPDPEMPTITDLGTDWPKTDAEMIYLEKKT